MDIAAGLSEAGAGIGRMGEKAAAEFQKDEAEQAKIKLMDQLTTVRESKGRQEQAGIDLTRDTQKQGHESAENKLKLASEEKRTGMTAGATVASAALAAAAHNKSTDALERIHKANNESAERIHAADSASRKEIAELGSNTKKEIADANRDALMSRFSMTKLPDESARALAEVYVDTGKTASVGARNTMAQVQIQSLVPQILKERGITEQQMRQGWGTVDAAKKDLDNQTKMQGQLSVFAENLQKNISGLADLREGLGPTAIPMFDKWVQGGRRAIGDPNVDALDFQLRSIATEAAKLTANQLGISPLSEGARKDYDAILNSFKNWETIERVIHTMEADSFNRLSSTRSAILDATNRIATGQPSAMPRVETPGATPNNPKGLVVLPYGDNGKVDLDRAKEMAKSNPNIEFSTKLGPVVFDKDGNLKLKEKK